MAELNVQSSFRARRADSRTAFDAEAPSGEVAKPAFAIFSLWRIYGEIWREINSGLGVEAQSLTSWSD